MAYLPQSSFNRRRSHLQNGTALDVSNDAKPAPTPIYDMSGDTRTNAPAPPPSPIAMPTQQVTPQPPQQQQAPQQQGYVPPKFEAPQDIQQPPSFVQSGTLSERLYNPLSTGAAQGAQSLGEAADFFAQEAGPSRTYEGIGAQDTLGRAFTGGAAGDIEAARGLVGAQYTGPQGLDQNTVAGLQNLVGQMQTRQEALGTGGGLQTLIQQSVAGLTPGQARYEAERQLPDSRTQARDLGFSQVAPLQAQIEEERQRAQAFAQQRTEEEADIAAKSRGFLGEERGKIEGDLASKIQAAQDQQQEAGQQYQGILGAGEEGRLAALRAANPELAAQFDTEARQKDIQADQIKQQILDDPKYDSIKDIDSLGLMITQRGKQFFTSEGEDLRKIVPDPKKRALLYKRQKELEQKFGTNLAGKEDFSSFNPLYHGQGFDAADPAQYLGFDPGTRPSRENISSSEQKAHFNNIQDIMGNLDNIGESEPFRAAQIFAEIDKYLEDENAALEAKGEELSKAQKEWARSVKSARKKARKAKREEEYAKIGSVIGAVVGTVAGGPVGGGVGYSAGGSIGASLA